MDPRTLRLGVRIQFFDQVDPEVAGYVGSAFQENAFDVQAVPRVGEKVAGHSLVGPAQAHLLYPVPFLDVVAVEHYLVPVLTGAQSQNTQTATDPGVNLVLVARALTTVEDANRLTSWLENRGWQVDTGELIEHAAKKVRDSRS